MKAYYETLFARLRESGQSAATAAGLVAVAFLDGKPLQHGKRKATAADRHAAFWAADFHRQLPQEAWTQESVGLALARYMGQDRHACAALIKHVAVLSPETVQRAARYSGLVLRQQSPCWREIEALADSHPESFGDFVQIFRIFEQAHRLRADDVERCQQTLASLAPLDLLAYASLYAFEHLLPVDLGLRQGANDGMPSTTFLRGSWPHVTLAGSA